MLIKLKDVYYFVLVCLLFYYVLFVFIDVFMFSRFVVILGDWCYLWFICFFIFNMYNKDFESENGIYIVVCYFIVIEEKLLNCEWLYI